LSVLVNAVALLVAGTLLFSLLGVIAESSRKSTLRGIQEFGARIS
jgi:hypothetical protein